MADLTVTPANCVNGYKPAQISGVPTEPCRDGFSARSVGNVVWCCQSEQKIGAGTGESTGATSSTGSTFAWSPQQQSSLTALIQKANQLLANPTGMSEPQRNRLYNYTTQGIKAPLAGELRSVEEAYGRAGLAGSPAQIAEQEKVRRSVRQQVADARAKLAIEEQATKAATEQASGTAASGILTQTAAMEKALEEANAARRGEGRADISQLLTLFSQLFGASSGSYQNVLSSIMSRLGAQTSGGAGAADWMPYLAYMAGNRLEGSK